MSPDREAVQTTTPATAVGTAVVTGAGSGIGRATAGLFARSGYRVLCADIDESSARSVAVDLTGLGLAARPFRADVSDPVETEAMIADALAWTGRLDVVVANAGVMAEGDVLSVGLEQWDRVLAVNATGAFLTARAALPHLIPAKGALIFTASTLGLVGMRGVAAYSASKGAVVALTRQLAADFADKGVRVNAVAPGAVRTPLSESQFRARARDEAEFDALLEGVIARYPIPRWGTPDDVAEAILFLASLKSGWITGQVLPVEGGLLEVR